MDGHHVTIFKQRNSHRLMGYKIGLSFLFLSAWKNKCVDIWEPISQNLLEINAWNLVNALSLWFSLMQHRYELHISIWQFGWTYLLSTHYLLAVKHYSTQRPILPSTHHSFLSNIPTDVCSILYLLSPCYQTLQQRCVHLFTMEDMFHPVPTFFLGLLHRKGLVSQQVLGVHNCLPSQRLCWLTLLLHLLSTHMS